MLHTTEEMVSRNSIPVARAMVTSVRNVDNAVAPILDTHPSLAQVFEQASNYLHNPHKKAVKSRRTNAKTKIVKNHKTVTISDVKVGDWAEVWYTTKDGKSWASKIEVKAAPKDKAMAKKGA